MVPAFVSAPRKPVSAVVAVQAASLSALKKEEAAAAVSALPMEAAAAVLPSLKPGMARAALLALCPERASLVLEEMSGVEKAHTLSAMSPDEIAVLIKAMPLEVRFGRDERERVALDAPAQEATDVLLVMSSGLAASVLSSKVLSHELSALLLHHMATGVIPDSSYQAHAPAEPVRQDGAPAPRLSLCAAYLFRTHLSAL